MAFSMGLSGDYRRYIASENERTRQEQEAKSNLLNYGTPAPAFGPGNFSSSSGGFGGGGSVSLGGAGSGFGGSGSLPGSAMPAPVQVNVGSNLQSMSEQQRYDPWSRYRPAAGDILAGKMGGGSPSDIYQSKLAQMVGGQFNSSDPSYQWRFDQGQKAAERSLAARGLLNSGNAAIELQQYGQGAASQEYGAQFDRLLKGLAGSEDVYNSQMSRLMKMAGVDIDPTAGGRLNVAQGSLGVDQGKLALEGQDTANRYALGLGDLSVKQQAAKTNQYSQLYGSLFGNSGGGAPQQTSSWDEYFAAKKSAGAAQANYQNTIGTQAIPRNIIETGGFGGF